MSAATATADAGVAPAKGKKKLILIVAAAVLVLVVGGVGALLLLKKGAADEEADTHEPAEAAAAAQPRDPKTAPAFVPLDVFTVNLADKEADRYAQVGITLELDDPATAESVKAFMPAIRNNILMVLAHKTAAELLEHDGKTQLAAEIRRETARGMGVEVDAQADADERPAGKKKRRTAEPAPLPVTAVYFSTFIIQ